MSRAGSFVRTPRGVATLVAVLFAVLYSASIAASGPWDPWETHYGEVARQIVVRHDPVDLWWKPGNGGPDAALETSFASKPALPFWLMALSFKLFGVGTNSDPAEMVAPLLASLALRLPSMLAGWASAAFLGHVLWRLVSPRAGILAAVVLLTMPQWAIANRQALTDMFFVGPIVLAVGAWALAWLQPDRRLRTRGSGWREMPWDRAFAGFVALFVISAIVPLAVIHQHGFDPYAWSVYGRNARFAQGLRDIQIHMFLYWALVLAVVVRCSRWRRRSQIWMGVAYIGAGLSLIGKGLIGPGLIGVFVLIDVLVSWRWDRLKRGGILHGVALFVLTSFPWHHAMALFRGERWAGELIIQNNLQRFSSGEQAQAVGEVDFYVETLGIAAFPWIALLPVVVWSGLLAFRRREVPSEQGVEAESSRWRRSQLFRWAFIWFIVSLWGLTYSTTKYFHYLLPALPSVAAMVGLWLDELLEGDAVGWRTKLVACVSGVALLAVVVRDAHHTPSWIAHLTTYRYTGMWLDGAPEVWPLAIVGAPFVIGLGLWLARRRLFAVGGWLLAGVLTSAYILNVYIPAASEHWSQRTAIAAYFAQRGPEDRLLSWWFYYRGETYFTKGDVWVMQEPDRKELADYIESREGQGSTLWFITIESHAARLPGHLPTKYRGGVEEVYRNAHYVLLRLPVE